MEELAGRVYADALLEIGKSEGKLSKFNDDLNLIAETLNSNPDIFKILNHPKVGKDQKKDVFKNMFESYVDKDIMNFLYIAVDKKRESSLQSIYSEFKKSYLYGEGITEGVVTTTYQMNQEELQKLEKVLSEKFDMKLVLKNEVDPSILGGIVINLDGKVIDDSVKSGLENLKVALKTI